MATMAIFVVFRVQNPALMRAAVASAFPNDHMEIGNNEWLISAQGTAKEISDRLGVTDQPPGQPTRAGNAMIFSMQNYYGRASSDIWEWIKTKVEASNG
jgi:hypothetical protein